MLILVEGAPGSGKSSTAHFLQVHLNSQALPVRWWYEEEKGHPVYCFHDAASLEAVVSELSAGKYERVIAAALEQWQKFASATRSSEQITILDGCLFGYLTWSLFPIDVPEAEIRDYVSEVERILLPCKPHLIYLRQADLTRSLSHISDDRGGLST